MHQSERIEPAERVLAPYPTINRLNSGWASGIQEPTGKKVSSSRSSQELCRKAQRKKSRSTGRMSRGQGSQTEWWQKIRIRSRKTEKRDQVKMSQKRRTWKISENNEVITKRKGTETEIKHGKCWNGKHKVLEGGKRSEDGKINGDRKTEEFEMKEVRK